MRPIKPSQLIISADDFGFTLGINQAIHELIGLGIVTATNVMTNMPYANAITDIAQNYPEVSIGVHINLTQGFPVLPPDNVETLITGSGQFYSYPDFVRRMVRGRIAYADCKREINAQVSRALELTNGRVDHWNSHQGIHRYEPVATAGIRVCRQVRSFGMRTHRHYFINDLTGKKSIGKVLLRFFKESYYKMLSWRAERYFFMPDALLVSRSNSTLNTIQWIAKNKLPIGVWELVCHPATTTEGLYGTTLLEARVHEYEQLRDMSIRTAITDSISVVNFATIACMREKQYFSD